MSDNDAPKRRLNLRLNLSADDLDEMERALRVIADDLVWSGVEQREQTSGGYASGHHFTLTCDESMTGDRFRSELAEWMRTKRESAAAAPALQQEGGMSDG